MNQNEPVFQFNTLPANDAEDCRASWRHRWGANLSSNIRGIYSQFWGHLFVVVAYLFVCFCLFVFVFSLTLWVKFSFSTIQPGFHLALFQGPAQLSVTRSTEKQVIKSHIAELGLGNEARIYQNLYFVDHCPSEQWHRLTRILGNDISSEEEAFTIGGNSQLAGFSRECPPMTQSDMLYITI